MDIFEDEMKLCCVCVSLRKDTLWWNLRKRLRHVNWGIIEILDHEEKLTFFPGYKYVKGHNL